MGVKFFQASLVSVIISEIIHSAQKKIIVKASRKNISNYTLADLSKASKKGVMVTLITDDESSIREEFKKHWTIVKDRRVNDPLFVRDDYEVFKILHAEKPEFCLGIKTFI